MADNAIPGADAPSPDATYPTPLIGGELWHKAFEAWCTSRYPQIQGLLDKEGTGSPNAGEYSNDIVLVAYLAWMASQPSFFSMWAVNFCALARTLTEAGRLQSAWVVDLPTIGEITPGNNPVLNAFGLLLREHEDIERLKRSVQQGDQS